MKIERKRWVIMRNNRTEIFCGLARNYQFKKISEIGDTAVKTYLSKNKALKSKTQILKLKGQSLFSSKLKEKR